MLIAYILGTSIVIMVMLKFSQQVQTVVVLDEECQHVDRIDDEEKVDER